MRPQHDALPRRLHVAHLGDAVHVHRVHVLLSLAIWLQRVVMPVDQHRRPRLQARVHAHGLAASLDRHEALPVAALAMHLRSQLTQKAAFEFMDLAHVHAHDERLRRGNGAVHYKNIVEFVVAWRGNTGPLVDLSGVEQVEDGKTLHVKHPVHALEAEAAFAVQEVGDVPLPEAGLLGQLHASQLAVLNSLPDGLAEVFLQALDLHGSMYSRMIYKSKDNLLSVEGGRRPGRGPKFSNGSAFFPQGK